MPRKVPIALATAVAVAPQLALPASAVIGGTSQALAATSGRLYTGTSYQAHQWGTVQVRIRVRGGKIVNVGATYPNHKPRSVSINERAIPILKREVLRAQSAKVQFVSGASDTSEAYKRSLQSALNKAHL